MNVGEKEKIIQVHELWLKLAFHDDFIRRFFDCSSKKMLDEKIRVLTGLIDGTIKCGSPEYYSILEDYPTDPNELWD